MNGHFPEAAPSCRGPHPMVQRACSSSKLLLPGGNSCVLPNSLATVEHTVCSWKLRLRRRRPSQCAARNAQASGAGPREGAPSARLAGQHEELRSAVLRAWLLGDDNRVRINPDRTHDRRPSSRHFPSGLGRVPSGNGAYADVERKMLVRTLNPFNHAEREQPPPRREPSHDSQPVGTDARVTGAATIPPNANSRQQAGSSRFPSSSVRPVSAGSCFPWSRSPWTSWSTTWWSCRSPCQSAAHPSRTMPT